MAAEQFLIHSELWLAKVDLWFTLPLKRDYGPYREVPFQEAIRSALSGVLNGVERADVRIAEVVPPRDKSTVTGSKIEKSHHRFDFFQRAYGWFRSRQCTRCAKILGDR